MNLTNSDKPNFLLSHHLGMGDHIAIGGLVRHIYHREATNCNEFYLLCYKHNEVNVARMFDDLPKLKLLTINHVDEIHGAIQSFNGKKEDLHLGDKEYLYAQLADDAFYTCFGYDKALRRQFTFRRDYKKEAVWVEKFVGDKKDYIFIHDDEPRGYKIDESKLLNLPKVRIPKEVPLFESLGIIEGAMECHVISSAFVCLLQSMPALNKNVTVHTSVRNEYLKEYFERDGLKTI